VTPPPGPRSPTATCASGDSPPPSKTTRPENGSRPGSSSCAPNEIRSNDHCPTAATTDRRDYRPLTPGEIAAIAGALSGLINILQNASPTDRAAVYQELGINPSYNPAANQIHALADLARVARGGGGGVEGGTFPRTTRETMLDRRVAGWEGGTDGPFE
jgi:hypothetical protein